MSHRADQRVDVKLSLASVREEPEFDIAPRHA
jgi:hypothetical protein